MQLALFAQNAPEHSLLEITGLPPLTIDDFGLKGSVHTVRQKSYQTSNGKEYPSGEVWMEFDKYGKIIKDRTTLSYKGTLTADFERTYTYNEKGKVTDMKWVTLDVAGSLPEYTYLDYNAKGQLTSSIYIGSNGYMNKTEWLYNANGGLLSWQETRGLETKPWHVKHFTFDQKNRITKVTDIMHSEEYGVDTMVVVYTYADGTVLPISYEVIVNDPSSTYSQLGVEIRTYNASGDHTRSTWPSDKDYELTISYTYDTEGNWTNRRSSSVTDERVERTITYFKELTPYIYRKTIAEAITPSAGNFSAFAQALQMQSKNATELMTMINNMQATAIDDMKKLQALGDLEGNTARTHAIQFLTDLSSSETRNILREVANAPQNLDPIRTLNMTLMGHANKMSAELTKLYN